jgi:hypothetical protein
MPSKPPKEIKSLFASLLQKKRLLLSCCQGGWNFISGTRRGPTIGCELPSIPLQLYRHVIVIVLSSKRHGLSHAAMA